MLCELQVWVSTDMNKYPCVLLISQVVLNASRIRSIRPILHCWFCSEKGNSLGADPIQFRREVKLVVYEASVSTNSESIAVRPDFPLLLHSNLYRLLESPSRGLIRNESET